MSRYQIQNRIGAGTYGIVYQALDKQTGRQVAVKKIRLTEEDDGVPSTAIRQICLLKSLTHPNIVTLEEVIYEDEKISLIFEYIDFDLKKYLEHIKRPLSLQEIKKLTYQLLKSLHFCHAHRCMHRDLKPQNLLVTKGGIVKLADFGLARTFSLPIKPYTHQVVTLWYRAPEILLGAKEYTSAIDMWSVGCIFAELANRRALFIGDSEIDQIFKIFKILGTPNETLWPQAQAYPDFKSTFPKWKPRDVKEAAGDKLDLQGLDLLRKLVALDPKERISASDAMSHPYFDDLDKTQFD